MAVQTNSQTEKKPESAPVKRRWLRRVVVVLCLLLIVVVVLVALLPTLLSTSAGKRFVMSTVSDQVAGEVEADSMSLSWRGGQRVTGLLIRDPTGSEVVKIGSIDLPDVSILGLLRGGLGLGQISIEQVRGDVIGYEDGTTNLQQALASATGKSASAKTSEPAADQGLWPEGLSFAFDLRDLDVTYRAQDAKEPIRMVVSQAQLTANDPTQLIAKLSASVCHGVNTGSVSADAKIDQLFDTDGNLQLAKAVAHIDSQLVDLPIVSLDAFLQEDGRLVTLLGSRLNGQVVADVTTAGGTAHVKSDTEQLHVNTRIAYDDAGLRREDESTIRYTLTPNAWVVINTKEGVATSKLQQPVDITIALNSLNLPFTEQGVDLSRLSMELALAISDTKLDINNVGEVTLESTTGSLKTSQLSQSLNANFNTTSGLNNKPGQVALDIQLKDLMNAEGQFDVAHISAMVNAQITNAPLAAILDELIPNVTKGLATRTLGKSMDTTVSLTTQPDRATNGMTGRFEVDALTEASETDLNTTLIGSFAYSDQAVQATLADGSYAKLTLNQNLLDDLMQAYTEPATAEQVSDAPQITLGAPAKIRLDVTQFKLALKALAEGGYALDPDACSAAVKLVSPEVRVMQDGEYVATLSDFLVDLVNHGMFSDTRLVLNSAITYPTGEDEDSKNGRIKSDTTIKGIARIDEKLSFANATYMTDTEVRQAPIDLVDALFDMGGELIAAVGARAYLTLNGEYSPAEEGTTGGLDMVMKNRYCSADLKLLVEDDRWILKNDAPMSFRVTPSLSQVFLKKINPFLGSAISAKLPVSVTVKKDGFSVPLRDVTLKDVNANVALDLGELNLRGEGDLAELLSQFGISNRNLLNVDFSPFTFSLDNGKLSYQDLVMSIDEVKFGFSGKVDLNSRALDLQMTIPGSTLSQISWLKGKINADQVIVIPLTGTFDEPKLDMKLLTGELAKAALQGQLENELGGTLRDKLGEEAGSAVGGLLNEILKTGKLPEADQNDNDDQDPEAKSDEDPTGQELTAEEREARKERRRLRRERLEQEKAEQEAQQTQ